MTHKNTNPSIAVLGGHGMLGRDLCPVLASCGWMPVAFDLPEFNLCDEAALRQVVAGHPVIVNCAAYTNVEKAESERDAAFAVNAEAVDRLGRLARRSGCHVLHVSTDFVFDGAAADAYGEDDEPNPVSVYGASKLEGERRLIDSGCSWCIVRVQWTYGAGGANFVEKIRARAETGATLRVVDDQTGSPTWTLDAAHAIAELLVGRTTGLFHYSATGAASRFEVAQRIIELCGLDAVVEPCSTSEFPSAARRPANSVFDCGKIERMLPGCRREWGVALSEYLSGCAKNKVKGVSP